MSGTISSLQGLAEFPSTVPWGALTTAIVESSESIEWLDLRSTGPERAKSYPRGTAFGPAAEVRWYRRASGLHVVLISDEGHTLGPESDPMQIVPVQVGSPGERAAILWGEPVAGTPGVYYENRIPQLLQYAGAPVCAPGQRLAIALREYRFVESEVRVTRYSGLRSLDLFVAEVR